MQIQQNTIHQSWILQPSQNGGGLCISNIKFIQNIDLIQRNIKAVVSVLGQKQVTFDQKIKHLRILIGDHHGQNIKCFFKSSYIFIHENIKKTNVLVHCQAGVSRSATIVIAYLMRQYHQNFETTLKQVKQKRPYIDPNKGFVKQLKSYQKQLIQKKKKQQSCKVI